MESSLGITEAGKSVFVCYFHKRCSRVFLQIVSFAGDHVFVTFQFICGVISFCCMTFFLNLAQRIKNSTFSVPFVEEVRFMRCKVKFV